MHFNQLEALRWSHDTISGVDYDQHDCTIENVWWNDVSEDALNVKGGSSSSITTVTSGRALPVDDKVIQHNGADTVKIDGFYGKDVSKLCRSCGTCGDKQRKVSVTNVYVVNPTNAVVTVNKNWNDEGTLSNVWVKSSYQGGAMQRGRTPFSLFQIAPKLWFT
ncbi:unnamed protein product [Phytophthora lilii]|uniref:Probable pectate lyase F n=1 Tax=Phytophthora lilii TaxID=2077276 RepID=A0A9W6WVU9_9STRA|nr:unnamed protein product [Phytophthora lilii]